MPLQYLVHAPRVLESGVLVVMGKVSSGSARFFAMPRMPCGVSRCPPVGLQRALVKPGPGIVFLSLRIPARQQPRQIFAVLKIFRHNGRSIRVMNDVLAKVSPVFENIANETSQKQEVRSGAQRGPDV